jgi:large subunit ribosomal protein L9
MASMFERDNAGFTEDYDPNAEPGTIAETGAEDGGQADAA